MIRKIFRDMLFVQIISAMTVTICMLIDSIMIGRFLGVDSMTAYGLSTPVLLVFAAFAVWRMQPLAAIAEVSTLFVSLIAGVGTQLAIRCGLIAGGMLLVGIALMLAHQTAMARARRQAS